MEAPANPPTGRLDAFDVGTKKLTVQTEFLARPAWHVETRIYLGGELKKVYTADASTTPEADLQRFVDQTHRSRREEIVNGLRERTL